MVKLIMLGCTYGNKGNKKGIGGLSLSALG